MGHVAALTTVSDVGHAKTQRADLAAAQQIFIKAQLVARNPGCQSCVMQEIVFQQKFLIQFQLYFFFLYYVIKDKYTLFHGVSEKWRCVV